MTEPISKSGKEPLKALSEIGPAVSSTLDLETVFTTIVARATQLAGTDAAVIFEYDERSEEFRPRAFHNFEQEIVGALRSAPLRKGEGAVGHLASTLEPAQIPDLAPQGADQSGLRGVLTRFGSSLNGSAIVRSLPFHSSSSSRFWAPSSFGDRSQDALRRSS